MWISGFYLVDKKEGYWQFPVGVSQTDNAPTSVSIDSESSLYALKAQ
jgi:hypothetical protein